MCTTSPITRSATSLSTSRVCGWKRYMNASTRQSALLPGDVDHGHHLAVVGRQRLLAQHMLARAQRADGEGGVGGVHGRDVDRIDGRRLQNVVVAPDHRIGVQPELLGEDAGAIGVRAADARERAALAVRQLGGKAPGDVARAENGPADRAGHCRIIHVAVTIRGYGRSPMPARRSVRRGRSGRRSSGPDQVGVEPRRAPVAFLEVRVDEADALQVAPGDEPDAAPSNASRQLRLEVDLVALVDDGDAHVGAVEDERVLSRLRTRRRPGHRRCRGYRRVA